MHPFERLAQDAIAIVGTGRRAILGIAGAPGSGKTTLARSLVARVGELQGPEWAAHVPMDGFHLGDAQLRRLGTLDRKGAPETFDAAGYAAMLTRIRVETETPLYAPGFERELEQPLAAALVVPPTARLVITEGNYLLLDEPIWRAARSEMNAVWFVTTDERTRSARLVMRHVEFGKEPDRARAWVAEVDQRNADLVSATSTRADRVIVSTGSGWDDLGWSAQ
ncbi:nucleoside/nucleotide kinase family protein [Williamsia phyllosphaerae]|uniref:Nucleoside/nucleotide kinase family protein n=1 Tax=Williamsia phyllosphaerae TaxID=885042 RepID=A0ABQ1UIR9_9NOCA|nr:nucleoside/nucleotide kinase family protein [Williamsia phyllosphaerae]GGF19110.1 nucleoside/nucleotide kinase family protein [Williamsia phyllosphaerae]